MQVRRLARWRLLFAGVLIVFIVATARAENTPTVKTRAATYLTATVQAMNLERRKVSLNALEGNVQRSERTMATTWRFIL